MSETEQVSVGEDDSSRTGRCMVEFGVAVMA